MFESNPLSWNQLDLAKKSQFIKNITARKISGDNSINLADLPLMWELYGKEFQNGGNLLSGEETESQDLNTPYIPVMQNVGQETFPFWSDLYTQDDSYSVLPKSFYYDNAIPTDIADKLPFERMNQELSMAIFNLQSQCINEYQLN